MATNADTKVFTNKYFRRGECWNRKRNHLKLQIKLQENLLGTMIDNRLTFETHMESICKEAGQKLHALARIANYMDISKKCSTMKALILSQYLYCQLIWKFHTKTLKACVLYVFILYQEKAF